MLWEQRKYELGDFKVIQYQILKTILRIVRQTVRRSTINILEVKGLMYTFVKRKCQEMIMNRCHQPKMWPFRNWVEKWLVQGSTWQTLRKQSWLPCRKINPCLYEWMASSVHISPFRIIFLYINVVYFFFSSHCWVKETIVEFPDFWSCAGSLLQCHIQGCYLRGYPVWNNLQSFINISPNIWRWKREKWINSCCKFFLTSCNLPYCCSW